MIRRSVSDKIHRIRAGKPSGLGATVAPNVIVHGLSGGSRDEVLRSVAKCAICCSPHRAARTILWKLLYSFVPAGDFNPNVVIFGNNPMVHHFGADILWSAKCKIILISLFAVESSMVQKPPRRGQTVTMKRAGSETLIYASDSLGLVLPIVLHFFCLAPLRDPTNLHAAAPLQQLYRCQRA